jgi:DNA-binding beta-propeller fold protein YncE
MVLGRGKYKYERVEGWAKLPEYFVFGDVVDVACDSKDRVYVFNRGFHPLVIFDRDGNFISCWGEGHFRQPHGIFIDVRDNLYLIDSQMHTVEKFTPSGELLMTLGTRNWGAPLITRSPFNMPTGLAIGPDGNLYVSDGYANFLIHKFSPDGKLLKTWGEPGKGPGQFALPHNIGVDRHGTVYVCDRENYRIQLFDSEGKYIAEWANLNFPADVWMDWKNDLVYVAEIGGSLQPKISIRDLKGKEMSSWEGKESEGKGVLAGSHGIWVDSRGDIYVGEIVQNKRILKFARV